MTTLEKRAKAYDEALDTAKKFYETVNGDEKELVGGMLPELKDSEDFKIRRELLSFLNERSNDYYIPTSWFSWLKKQGNLVKYYEDKLDKCACDNFNKGYKKALEKQGKPTEINPSEFDSRLNSLLKQFESLSKKELVSILSFYLNMLQNDGTYKEEITDKVEPKFHKGDWVVSKFDRKTRQISEVHCDEYNEYYIVEGNEYDIEAYDRLHHLWTIQDAKDGDVLATKDAVFIFKHIDKIGLSLCKSYCEVIGNSKLGLGFEFSINGVYPATKEQREQLEKAITEAGYKWDAEHKELKKIEHKHICELDNSYACVKFPFKAKVKSSGKIVTILSGQLSIDCKEWIKYCSDEEDEYKVYKPENLELVCDVEPNPTWSEEDEEIYRKCICAMRASACGFPEEEKFVEQVDNWLKSIKDRYTWKPNNAQMDAIKDAIDYLGRDTKIVRKHLMSLYEQLKKLKVE